MESASATIRRITALGLTDREAVGWYRNNVQKSWVSRFAFTSFSGFALVLGTVFANTSLESSLETSMILQHFVFIMVGLLLAYAAHSAASSGISVRLFIAYESLLRKVFLMNRYGTLSFSTAGLLTCYWALPSSFDAAPSNSLTQLMMCLSFTCVGALVLVGAMCVNSHVLPVLSIVLGKIMGLFGAFLIITPTDLYNSYPVVQQAETGVIMIGIMTIIDMAVIPCWLYKYFKGPDHIGPVA